jgi:hypothetical protein
MQVHTPARQPGRRVGLDGVPSCYEAKQAGLDRTLLAAYTGTHYGRIRGMLLGARGHYTTKSTASASLKHRPGTAMVRPAVVLAVLAWPGRLMWTECGPGARGRRAPRGGPPGDGLYRVNSEACVRDYSEACVRGRADDGTPPAFGRPPAEAAGSVLTGSVLTGSVLTGPGLTGSGLTGAVPAGLVLAGFGLA